MPVPAIALLAGSMVSRIVARNALTRTFSRYMGGVPGRAGAAVRISTNYPAMQLKKLDKVEKRVKEAAGDVAEDAAMVAVGDVKRALRRRLHRPTDAFLNTITATSIKDGSRIQITEQWSVDIMQRLIYGGVERAKSESLPLIVPVALPLDAHGNVVGYRNGRLFRAIERDENVFIVPLSQTGTDGRDLSHLHPGIWEKTGNGQLRVLAFFVWKRRYRPILPWKQIGVQSLMKAVDRNLVSTVTKHVGRI